MYDARRLIPVSGSPNTSTEPPLGGVRPAMMFSRVDLPQPLGPTIATKRPAAISSVTSRTAVYSANRFSTVFSDTADAGGFGSAEFKFCGGVDRPSTLEPTEL